MVEALAARRPILLVLGVTLLAVATGILGLDANGYLVPAAVALVVAALVWLGRARPVLAVLTWTNLASGIVLIVVLAAGDGLGDRKLDVSGVALLTNLATGGPAIGLLAPAILLGLRRGKPLRRWFERA